MNKKHKVVFVQAQSWPQADEKELAECAREIETGHAGVYYARDQELREIDEALSQLTRGDIATRDEVDAALANFRSA